MWPTLGIVSQGPGQQPPVPPEGARVKRPSWNRHRIGAAHSFILRGRFQALATTASLDMCPPMGVDEGVPSWAVLLPWASQRRQQGAHPGGGRPKLCWAVGQPGPGPAHRRATRPGHKGSSSIRAFSLVSFSLIVWARVGPRSSLYTHVFEEGLQLRLCTRWRNDANVWAALCHGPQGLHVAVVVQGLGDEHRVQGGQAVHLHPPATRGRYQSGGQGPGMPALGHQRQGSNLRWSGVGT